MIAFLNRFRARLNRGRLADELGRELKFHQAMLEREHRARGLSPADAASAARRDLGNRTAIHEGSRDMWSFAWLEDPMLDLRYGVRALRRTPAFTVVAVLTLALGMGAMTAMFAVVNGVLLKPLPYGSPDRLVGVWHDMAPLNMTHAQHTVGTYFTYQRLAHTIDGIAAYQQNGANVSEPGGASAPQRVTSALVSATLIPLLQVAPLRGRAFTTAEDLPNAPLVAIISEGMWRARFGSDAHILDRTIEVNGHARRIVGVMPTTFRFPEAATDIWLPLGLDPAAQNGGGFNYNAVARLKPGVSAADARARLRHRAQAHAGVVSDGCARRDDADAARSGQARAGRHPAEAGHDQWHRRHVVGRGGCVGARASRRLRERDEPHPRAGRRPAARDRRARGARGGARARDDAFSRGICRARGRRAGRSGSALHGRRSARSSARGPAEIPRLAELTIDAQSVAFAALVAVVVAMGCTAIPVMRIGRSNLSKSLREGGRSGTAGRVRHRVRGALVAAQMAMALVVLAGSALLVRTFQHLNAIKPGFDPSHVETFWVALPSARYPSDSSVVRFYSQLLDRVSGLAGVKAAGVTSRVPLEQHGVSWNPYYPENDDSYARKLPPLVILTTVDAGYFRVMGIPLIAGRTLERLDAQHDPEVLISRRVSEVFYHDSTGAAALGKRFRSLPSGPWSTVIGVVADARDSSLAAPPSPTVYYPEAIATDTINGQTARTMALVVRTAGDPLGTVGAVQATMRDLDPTLPMFEIQPMTAVFSASMATLTFIILILGAAAAVTLILGAIGLYGVMAYIVTLRTRELGVRVALGAQPGTVAAMMTRQGLVLAGIGLAAGLAVFALLARFLRSLLFGVAPGDPVALTAASIILLAIAAFATWIPARRASRVDPAEALRAE